MNSTSIQTTIAPLISFLAGLAAGKGLFGLDSATWTTILGAVAACGATLWGALAASKSGVTSAAASYPDTKVVTDAKTAAAGGPDVLSNTDVKIVAK